jgi:hypothetical protein
VTPLTGLPAETIRRLRELDPAAGSVRVSPETSRTVRNELWLAREVASRLSRIVGWCRWIEA